jgi:hypothetical protein
MLHIKLSDDARARVRTTPETEALGLAGLCGPIFGETRPSSSGVDVIGHVTDDYALAVHFESRDETRWFAPDLLEHVGPPPRPRGAWAVNEPPQRDDGLVTRLLGWLEEFLPRLGRGRKE